MHFNFFTIFTACSTFGNCYDCMDITNNAVLDAGDCLECAPGYVINEDLTQCISTIIFIIYYTNYEYSYTFITLC